MDQITAGSAVTCGYCGMKTIVSFVTDRQGTDAFDLACLHRNAVCPTCGGLVLDASESIYEVHPACRSCNPEMFDDEEDV